MELGIVRKIDELGRLVLPKEMRDALGWGIFTELNITTKNGKVILEKANHYCCICNNESKDMIEVNGKSICKDCLKEIKSKLNN